MKYGFDDEDKAKLYKAFIKAMMDWDYTSEFIGSELAYIARALEQASEDERPQD